MEMSPVAGQILWIIEEAMGGQGWCKNRLFDHFLLLTLACRAIRRALNESIFVARVLFSS